MTQPTPTPPSDKRDLLAAFDQVLDREQEKKVFSASPPPPTRTSYAVTILCVVAWGWLGYAWLARPAWLFPQELAAVPTPAEAEATMRFGMYLELERVFDYRAAHGRLPGALGEAGDVEEGVDYMRTGDTTFVLTGQLSGRTLRLESTDSREEFLRPAGLSPSRGH